MRMEELADHSQPAVACLGDLNATPRADAPVRRRHGRERPTRRPRPCRRGNRMRRRDLLTLLGGVALAAPMGAGAQQKTIPVIGLLSAGIPTTSDIAAFHQGLSDTGYVDGQNLSMEYRRAEGHYDRLPAMAADLVSRKVDVIVAIGNAALAAKSVTS